MRNFAKTVNKPKCKNVNKFLFEELNKHSQPKKSLFFWRDIKLWKNLQGLNEMENITKWMVFPMAKEASLFLLFRKIKKHEVKKITRFT